MYYTNEFINELIPQISARQETYASNGAKQIAKILDFRKDSYKLFGVYWWGVKDALRKYVANGKWYCGAADDPLMKERADHGSEFRNVLAANYYMNDTHVYGYRSGHDWYDTNGDQHSYNLYDEDAGM
ncbi:MAG: hypothetical protein Ta2B_05700 [Termitinemataceae bacterium]|nr:MAG: hypothetical protein Ta2B_05700 [Termitinemataceae bacterium]